MSLDRGILIGTAAGALPERVEVCRSYSYKLNLGPYGRPYESADFFASRKIECNYDDQKWISEMLLEECVAEVREAVAKTIAEVTRKAVKREESERRAAEAGEARYIR